MIRAWRRPDGRYRLDAETHADHLEAERLHLRCGEEWSIRPDQVDELGFPRVYGVVTGPSSCGCDPAMFRWVTESEVQAGRTSAQCMNCSGPIVGPWGFMGYNYAPYQCDIIDVCGEADVAISVYEAEFKGGVEATR